MRLVALLVVLGLFWAPIASAQTADPLDVAKDLVRCTGKLKDCRADRADLELQVRTLHEDVRSLTTRTSSLTESLSRCEDRSVQTVQEVEEARGLSPLEVLGISGGVALIVGAVAFVAGAVWAR